MCACMSVCIWEGECSIAIASKHVCMHLRGQPRKNITAIACLHVDACKYTYVFVQDVCIHAAYMICMSLCCSWNEQNRKSRRMNPYSRPKHASMSLLEEVHTVQCSHDHAYCAKVFFLLCKSPFFCCWSKWTVHVYKHRLIHYTCAGEWTEFVCTSACDGPLVCVSVRTGIQVQKDDDDGV